MVSHRDSGQQNGAGISPAAWEEKKMNTYPIKGMAFGLGAMLLLFTLVFTAPAVPRAGEKTPPCYPEGESAKARKPEPGPKLKDFSTLFPGSPASRAGTKTPPYYEEGERKARTPARKARAQDPAEKLPAIDEKEFRTQEYVVKEGDWLAK
ncbi:MAG: hypothetical protein JRJ85_28870, partial [Deltaproteobacteria bacterium]|nr:hypothetical protein [Deltaproteobacteria bacterium]